jgi:dipeptidyl-peptidase-4
MNIQQLFFLYYLLIWFLLSGFHPLTAQKKKFTYQQIYENGGPEVLARLPVIDGWLNDEYYLQYVHEYGQKTSQLMKVSVIDGRMYPFIDYQNLNDRYLAGFDLREAEDRDADYKSFILRKQDDLYYFSLTNSTIRRLTTNPGIEQNPTLSPDGRYVAFTRDHDLYIIDIQSGDERRLTNDGSATIYNGWAAWVYYEEILGRESHYRAFWWSPSSELIAFLRFDETQVPEFPLVDAEGIHGKLELQRYPKAGDPVPQVRLGMVTIKTGKIKWIDFDQTSEYYLARPFWSPDSKVLVGQWFNRAEDLARLYSINSSNGQKKIVYEEKSPAWIEFYADIHVLKNNKGFILRSDHDGWYHLYYYNMDGVLQSQLTSGNWNVTSLVKVDEQNQQIYFIGTADNPTQKHLYRINFAGKNLQRLTPAPGVHKTDISPSAKYFIDRYSSIGQPSKIDLYRSDGKYLRTIGDQKTAVFDNYEWGRVEIFSIPTDDGLNLPALWILPANLKSDRRYPVIFSIYGGPESAKVENQFRSLQDHYFAQQGIITIVVDNRGSGYFGKAGMLMMNRHLGKWEVDDLITAVKWLRRQPFIDSTRIGITGSSYGGYTTCMALTYGADYFTHGVASLSVTDWRLYDAVYTERYMDKPDENPQGYEFASVMTHADRLKGKLLLIHGSMDDNVHYQNTLQLVSKLQDLGIQFELMIYPGERHGLGGLKRRHEDRLIFDFWMRNFLGRE